MTLGAHITKFDGNWSSQRVIREMLLLMMGETIKWPYGSYAVLSKYLLRTVLIHPFLLRAVSFIWQISCGVCSGWKCDVFLNKAR